MKSESYASMVVVFLSFFIYFGLSVFVYAREMQFCELAPNEWTEHLLSIDRKGEKGKKHVKNEEHKNRIA